MNLLTTIKIDENRMKILSNVLSRTVMIIILIIMFFAGSALASDNVTITPNDTSVVFLGEEISYTASCDGTAPHNLEWTNDWDDCLDDQVETNTTTQLTMEGTAATLGTFTVAAQCTGAHGSDSAELVVAIGWDERPKILDPDGASNDNFGNSVAVYGDYAVIGANKDYSESGTACLFQRSNGAWSFAAKFSHPYTKYAYDHFGNSVAIDDDTMIVGMPGDPSQSTNSVGYVFFWQRDGDEWEYLGYYNGLSTDDMFGNSIAIDGDTIVIGAPGRDDNGTDSGCAYVFYWDGDSWDLEGTLEDSTNGAAGDYFGHSVAVEGDTVVVGAYKDDDNGTDSGTAYVFTRSGGSWSFQQKLEDSTNGAANDYFGYSVAVYDDIAVIGAYGDDDNGSASGSAYIFTRSGGTWTQEDQLFAANPAADDNFGKAVAINDNVVVIGCENDDDKGTNSGSAYVFKQYGTSWVQREKLTNGDGDEAGDLFGSSVAISSDQTIIIGATGDSDNGTDAGAAYINAIRTHIGNTVWAWGYNSYGQLGNGTTTDSTEPVMVLVNDDPPVPLTGIIEISCYGDHVLALKNDGTVWAWGNNSDGQLGNGTTGGYSSLAVQV